MFGRKLVERQTWSSHILLDRSIMDRLGAEVFQKVYDYLKQAREQRKSEADIKDFLSRLVEKPSDCFEVDQLLYYEEQLQKSREGQE